MTRQRRESHQALVHGRGRTIEEIAAAAREESVAAEQDILEEKGDVAIDVALGSEHLALDGSDSDPAPLVDSLAQSRDLSRTPSKADHAQLFQYPLLGQCPVNSDVIWMGMCVQDGGERETNGGTVGERLPSGWAVDSSHLTGLHALEEPDQIVLSRRHLVNSESPACRHEGRVGSGHVMGHRSPRTSPLMHQCVR